MTGIQTRQFDVTLLTFKMVYCYARPDVSRAPPWADAVLVQAHMAALKAAGVPAQPALAQPVDQALV